jgi:aryl-alcohol dehydrogenase-like predicted oxidoreductase
VARELGVGIVAYGALSRGLLGSSAPVAYAPNDFRAHLPRFSQAHRAHNQRLVQQLEALAAQAGCSAAQLAIAWLLSRGDDVVALVGTTKRERLQHNLGACQVTLGDDLKWELDSVFAPGAFAGTRYPAEQMGLVAR